MTHSIVAARSCGAISAWRVACARGKKYARGAACVRGIAEHVQKLCNHDPVSLTCPKVCDIFNIADVAHAPITRKASTMALSLLQREFPAVPGVSSPQPPAPSGLSDIFAHADLLADLHAVELLLQQRTASHSAVLDAAGAHTVASGGKRLRAALVLLAARLGHYDLSRAIHPAAAVELLHGASLIHDDLVDHTLLRRGHVTVHARWGSQVALMLGDYFFALSADELSGEPDSRIITYYADAAQTIVE